MRGFHLVGRFAWVVPVDGRIRHADAFGARIQEEAEQAQSALLVRGPADDRPVDLVLGQNRQCGAPMPGGIFGIAGELQQELVLRRQDPRVDTADRDTAAPPDCLVAEPEGARRPKDDVDQDAIHPRLVQLRV